MADINIVQAHALSPENARIAAQKVADKLAGDYALECRWDGDVLGFELSGVEGALTLAPHQAQMQIKLGFFYASFASAIEEKVTENMRKVFGATA